MAVAARPVREVVVAACIAAAFLATVWSYLPLPPPTDNVGILWLVRNVAWWSILTDPLSIGFSHMFIFDPGLPLLHFLVDFFMPVFGMASFHLPGVIASVGSGMLVARLTYSATRRDDVAAAAAALYLLATPVWYNIGTSFNINYSWATAFSLASITPLWLSCFERRTATWAATIASALLYGCGLVCKPSIAALPLLMLVLEYGARGSLRGALARLIPHAAVLAGMVAWNVSLYGGLGGYLNAPQILWTNAILALPALLYGTWGTVAVVAPIALLPLMLRRQLATICTAGFIASAGPFLLADPIEFNDAPLWAGRLEFGWALLVLCGCAALREFGRRRLVAAVVAILLGVQIANRPDAAAMVALASGAELDATFPTDRPTALIHHDCFAPYVRSLLGTAERASLRSYCSEVLWWLDEARGQTLPTAAIRHGFPDEAANRDKPFGPGRGFPRLTALRLDGIALTADSRGRMRLTIPDDLIGQIYLAVIYENGPSRVVTGYAVGRSTATFPLNYSVREVWLFRIPTGDAKVAEPWPIYVWESPFFISPFPSTPNRQPLAKG